MYVMFCETQRIFLSDISLVKIVMTRIFAMSWRKKCEKTTTTTTTTTSFEQKQQQQQQQQQQQHLLSHSAS